MPNPFIDFEPPKSLIKDCIQALKVQAREILDDIALLHQYPWAIWLIDLKLSTHKQLIHKIKKYELYLKGGSLLYNNNQSKDLAKQKKISDLYVGKLKSARGRFYGRCPFHEDRSPSFVIYPNNTAHCFGCNWNGDSIDFIMSRDMITFQEAIKFLITC